MDSSLEELVRQRAGARCEYCHIPAVLDSLDFQFDHIIARQHGGLDDAENLALSCWTCNVHKGPNIAGVDPVTGAIVRLFHPRRDAWKDHFSWHGSELTALTPEGRVTIYVLAINAPHRVVLRNALLQEGEVLD
jgi:hypothetical protein